MVRLHPDPPSKTAQEPIAAQGSSVQRTCTGQATKSREARGAVAQLGEHLLCKQGVVGSIPSSSTTKEEASIAKASTESRGKREGLLLIFGSVPRRSVVL